MTDRAELERRVRQIIAAASVIAEAPGTSFIPSGHSQYDHAEPTTGMGGNLVDRLRLAFQSCKSREDLVDKLDWAERQIETTRQRTLPPRTPFRERILIEWAGYHYEEVARVTSTARTTVRRWREEAGLRAIDGLLPDDRQTVR